MTVSNCTVVRRQRAHRLKHDLDSFDQVLDVDLLAPHEGQHQCWTISAIVAGATVPPLLCEAVGAANCRLLADATGTRGDPQRLELVARA